jgi:hypothetical protein
MNKKIIGILAMLTLLTLVIAQVPVHAATPALLPSNTHDLINKAVVGGLLSAASVDQASELLPALGLIYQMYNVGADGQFADPTTYLTAETVTVNGQPQTMYVPREWYMLWHAINEVQEGMPELNWSYDNITGPVRMATVPDSQSLVLAGLPVTPGTWTAPVSLATNGGPGLYLPEFNPAIAANPMNQANQIEGQFDVSVADLGTGQALRCSVKASPFATAVPTFLPLEGTGAAAGGLSFCERALPAFSDDGIAYVLYTDYEIGPGVARTLFKMIRSVDSGAHWTDLAGNAMNAGPNTIPPFAPDIRAFPLIGPPSGELPLFPSLAVSGSGAATTRIHVAYSTLTNLITSDIRSIESINGGTTFSNPVMIESVNPFIPGPLRLLLAPSNAYLQPGVVHVVWYDDIALPPLFPGGLFRLAYSRSMDNGVTYTAPVGVIRPESLMFDFWSSPAPLFVWPTEFPHIAADAATNSVYVVCGESWNWFIWFPRDVLDVFMLYSQDGGATWNWNYPFPEWHIADAAQFFPAIAVEHNDGTVHVTYASKEDVFGNLPFIFFGPWPWFDMVYTASTPTQLVPGAEQWVEGQRVSGYVWDTWFLGLFFSVAANNGHVYAAYTTGILPTAATWGYASMLNDDTWLGTGTKPPPPPVGGAVLSTDMLTLLMPYMAVAILATIGLAYALRRRFRSIQLPHIPSIRS